MKENRILSILLMFPLMLAIGVTWARSAQGRMTERILVSAAMSLKTPLEKIGREFSRDYPGFEVDFNFGSSGSLRMQIEGGAPVDVFASASVRHMNILEKRKLIHGKSRTDFAGNEITLIVPENASNTVTLFSDLELPGITRIAIGNPATSPAGRYAEETLRSLGLWEQLGEKLVLCEHVRQILDYVARGEVDAGILYATDAVLRKEKIRIAAWAPPETHGPIIYPAAVLSKSAESKASQVFVKYLGSETARGILRKHGFVLTESGL